MDLSTNYLGLAMKSPLIASASPLNRDVSNIRALEDNGAGAVVLPSIFEEQIEAEVADVERLFSAGVDSFPEALSYFPQAAARCSGVDRHLQLIRAAGEAVDIPVIASLNGISDNGWTDYARLVEEAGADALELNIFFVPTDVGESGLDVEQRYIDILRSVDEVVDIPIAMKLSPYFSSIGHFITQLDDAGADGFVLFNRFYEPDIDLGTLRLRRDLELSSPSEIRLPLLWIAALIGQVRGSLAASTGVESAEQVIKYLLAGADVVMTTSALLRHGVAHMKTLVDGLTQWLAARDLASVNAVRGSLSQRRVRDPVAFERANYVEIL
ncbi:MAG: dihydroorotate dehydrogenase-like protein, partial [Bradyrhizobiaceae bacterium]|nr:dihydroorotate dehydrogenase-like protein [Bradyrhizobiaceae bacterium]